LRSGDFAFIAVGLFAALGAAYLAGKMALAAGLGTWSGVIVVAVFAVTVLVLDRRN
jgi:hypothetical protein